MARFYADKALNGNTKNHIYININYIKNISSKLDKKNYFAYYSSYLFSDSQKYKNFYKNISSLFCEKSYDDLIFDLISEFQNFAEDDEKYYFILDNIYSKVIFDDLIIKYEEKISKIKKNFYVLFFIQLNDNTAEFLNSNLRFIFINNDNRIRPQGYIDSLFVPNYEKNYLVSIEKKFNDVLSKYENLDKFILILKAKYLSLTVKYKSIKEIILILQDFYEFFHISCLNKHKKIIIESIEFKNDKIKEFFNNKFNSLLCQYINKNEYGIFNEIINSSIEGILHEKQIILNLISQLFIKKLVLERIYCCKFQNINFDIAQYI